MTSTDFSQRHQDQQQVHSMNQLAMAMVEDSEEEAMVEALAMPVDRLSATIVEP